MEIDDILKALRVEGPPYPLAAMTSALEQREAITPELLKVLDEGAVADTGDYQLEHGPLPILGLHLLGEFREQAAFPRIVRMMSRPGEEPFELIGDTVTEALDSILAATYDGQRGLLEEVVENRGLDEYVRSAALRALILIAREGRIDRGSMIDYMRALYGGRLERKPVWTWHAWVEGVGLLPAPELLREAREALDAGLVDGFFLDWDTVERLIEEAKGRPSPSEPVLIDAVKATSWWACFREEEEPRLADGDGAGKFPWTWVNEPEESVAPLPSPDTPKGFHPVPGTVQTGRNDPCPCGSGKKYKKCCG